jgi:hypothetical protein
MNKSTIATILLTATALVGLAPSIATGDTQNGLSIADNDGVYIDAKSFQVVPGKAKGNAADQIKSLDACDLGPAAIIFRSGNRLYIADEQSEMAGAQAQVATGERNYAYDPRASKPILQGGGSAGYNNQAATDYAYDPRAGSPIRNPNPWANDYAYDPSRVTAAAQPSLIYDPDYVEYRLKKAFDDNWTPVGTPAGQ